MSLNTTTTFFEKICWSDDFSCDAQLSSSRWRTRVETSWWEAPSPRQGEFQSRGSSSILCSYLAHLLSQSLKNQKKNCTPKKFLIFQEIELSSSSSKKFLIFSYISGNRNRQKCFTFEETETLISFLYFRSNFWAQPQKIKKSASKKSLYFRKWNFLAPQKT